MNESINIISIVSIISILLAPVIAVLIAQYLQNRAIKHQNKMDIFKILMMYRAMNHVDAVKAFNMIDIVFSDSKDVREKWKNYFDVLNSGSMKVEKAIIEKHKLLEAIAKDLGYKDKISWETIQQPYLPSWLGSAIDKNEKYTEDLHQLLSFLKEIIDPSKLQFAMSQLFKLSQTEEIKKPEQENQ